MAVPWTQRIGALAFYAGLAPLCWPFQRRRREAFTEHHFLQAAGCWVLFAMLTLAFMLSVGALSLLLVQHRFLYENYQAEGWLLFTFRKLYLAWAVFPLFGAGLALAGRDAALPVITPLGGFTWSRRLGLGFLLALYLAAAGLGGVAVCAARLAPAQGPAPVYMLYDNTAQFPRWLFALGFYPVSRAAVDRYGPGSAVVAELTEDHLAEALRHGRYVFLAAHGTENGLLVERRWFPPGRVGPLEKNPGLSFVYLASCDSGAQAAAWREAFAPAAVKTYDRLTAVAEHVFWLWRTGPATLRRIAAPRPD